ncbi:MAG: hypothetical protein IKR65_05565, partial [Selenomonadaceae bacterium]|nr:hypothetical protein [Selenomonadaceae bacterium]
MESIRHSGRHRWRLPQGGAEAQADGLGDRHILFAGYGGRWLQSDGTVSKDRDQQINYNYVRNDADFNALYQQDYFCMQGLSFIVTVAGMIYHDIKRVADESK